MKRFKAICAYDGTDFLGWQSQKAQPTIQDTIELALFNIHKTPLRIHGSGRTDARVHANGQVFHFDTPWAHAPIQLLKALNTFLPPTVQILDLKEVSSHFHARFSAVKKRYIYYLCQGYALPTQIRYCYSLGPCSLNIFAMKKAAQFFIGIHDFSAFAAASRKSNKDSPIKHLMRLDVYTKGSRLKIVTEASGYMYKMVRSIVGSLICVGLEKYPPAHIQTLLFGRKRTKEIPTAPPQGLFLEKVFY